MAGPRALPRALGRDRADQPKLIAVSLRLQARAAFESCVLLRWGLTSTGKRKSPMPIVNLHNTAGISFHQFDLPGYPDSHVCLRLAPDDAEWIYRWCASWKLNQDRRTVLQDGTPVAVFGE